MRYSPDLELIGNRLGRSLVPSPSEAAALSDSPIVMAGFGAIARPFTKEAANQGAPRITLVDPKRYVTQSVASQCRPGEVGRAKTDAGAECLRALGADVTAYARDLDSVPAGIVDKRSIVVASMDNRRGDILANRMSVAVGARLLKINVEPELRSVSIRSYDYRDEVTCCAECQFTSRHYDYLHPRSCDGSSGERRTNSPTWFSRLAAGFGWLAFLDVLADGGRAGRWIGHEWQYCHDTGRLLCSQLTPNQHCRCDHQQRWSNVQRLPVGPERVRLRELLEESGANEHARLRFCQQVSTRSRCRACRHESQEPRWLCEPGQPICNCSRCGGAVAPIPFFTFSEIDAGQLASVLDRPLADWGVEPNAVIEVRHGSRIVTFVVGKADESEGVSS